MSATFTPDEVSRAVGVAPTRLPDPETRFDRVMIDSRRAQPGDLFVALAGERYDGDDFQSAAVRAGATGIVGRDRAFDGADGVALWVHGDGRRALQAIAGLHRSRLETHVVAITGSNGKTTTKELVASVLAQRFAMTATVGNLNNQVGVPLTLLEIGPEHTWAVVELGMSQPGEIAPLVEITRPEIGIVTNVAASHLEGLGSIEAVLEEKMAVGRALGPADLLVYGGDQLIVAQAAGRLGCRRLSYGLEPHNDLVPESWSLDDEGRGCFELEGRTLRLRLTGKHNILNALAAVAVGREAGLSISEIAGGIAEPDALPLRMQLERWGEVTALVDCYNANPESVISAASTLGTLAGMRRRIAVLGPMLELGEQSAELHHAVGRELADIGIEVVVTVGEEAAPMGDGARESGLAVERFADPEVAATWIGEHLRPGDAVLFKASRGAALESVVAPVRSVCLDGTHGGAAFLGTPGDKVRR